MIMRVLGYSTHNSCVSSGRYVYSILAQLRYMYMYQKKVLRHVDARIKNIGIVLVQQL